MTWIYKLQTAEKELATHKTAAYAKKQKTQKAHAAAAEAAAAATATSCI
jgi:hypothetical protein